MESNEQQNTPLFNPLFKPELNLSGQKTKANIDYGRLDGKELKAELNKTNLQGRVGFTGKTKENTSYGLGVNLSASKGIIKTPKELRQFGVPEELEFGDGKLKARSYDAFISLQNIFGVEGLESRINAGYTPSDYEKDIKNIGLNLKYKFAEGGTVMKQQMEMFEDGGLKDEGGMTDEVSGNDVPSGSTREEVRDDIPAQLSEGEFVFPADVVRFLGLEKLMQMRQKAKMGLQKMEAMGQMGNSEEATMPDDMPFDLNDLDMEDEQEKSIDSEEEIEYNSGGVVKAAVGAFMGKPYNYDKQKNADPVAPYMPARNILGASDPKNLVGGIPQTNEYGLGSQAGMDSEMFEERRYVNEATGAVRFVSFNKATGQTTTNIKQLLDQGFIRKDEAIKEAAKTATPTPTYRPRPQEQDDGQDSYDEQQREEEEYGAGGGRVSLGGEIDVEKTNRLGGPVRGSSLTKNSTTFGIQYGNARKTSLGDIAKGIGSVLAIGSGMGISILAKGAFDAYQYSIGKMPADKVAIYTINGIPTVVRASVYNRIAVNPRGPEALSLIADAKTKKSMLDAIRKADPKLSRKEAIKLTNKNFELTEAKKGTMKTSKGTEKTIDFIKRMEDKRQKELSDRDGDTGLYSFESDEAAANRAAVQANQEMAETNFNDPIESSYESGDYSNDVQDNMGYYDDDPSFNKGGLAGKKKTPKPKKMKRGGLASR